MFTVKDTFKIVRAIFRNQDNDTLSEMVGDEFGIDGLQIKVETTSSGSTRTEIQNHKIALVPVDGEILYNLALAVENVMKQRKMWGDRTVDWMLDVVRQNEDLVQEFYDSCQN